MTERRLPTTWRQALAFAMTGQRLDGIEGIDDPDGQDRLDLPALARTLLELRSVGRVVIASSAAERHEVPADLRAGIGPAQFWAALSELAIMLNPTPPDRRSPLVADRPLTPQERRLIDDSPPHHGS